MLFQVYRNTAVGKDSWRGKSAEFSDSCLRLVPGLAAFDSCGDKYVSKHRVAASDSVLLLC